MIPEPVVAGDDYLNVNIFTPDLGDARLPVLVWIHGGGLLSGCNRSPWYRGASFARDGVVVVAVNYRLGVEGFLQLDGADDNRGVLDWLAGMRWVHDNIAAFGGDPDHVTVGGQSAGGIAALTLLGVPAAKGLFHRVIDMSGPGGYSIDRPQAEAAAQAFCRSLGIAPTRDVLLGVDPTLVIETQAGLLAWDATDDDGVADPAAALALAASGGPPLRPLVDGELLVARPLDVLRSGRATDIDLLVSCTAEEMNVGVRLAAPTLDLDAAVQGLVQLGLEPSQAARFGRPERT